MGDQVISKKLTRKRKLDDDSDVKKISKEHSGINGCLSKKKTKKKQTESNEERKVDDHDKKNNKSTDDRSPPNNQKKIKKKQLDTSEKSSEKEGSNDHDTNKKTTNETLPNSLSNFPISQEAISGLKSLNITTLFPIQIQCLNPVINGSDVLGRARTGTGKTLAFSLPIVEVLLKDQKQSSSEQDTHNIYQQKQQQRYFTQTSTTLPRALIMVPTRELALQVYKVISSLSFRLKSLCVYGGTPYIDQIGPLRKGVDIVVGTPGRLIDLIEKGALKLSELKFVCMDEADQMLDIGFADDMNKILNRVKSDKNIEEPTNEKKNFQVLLFSATLPGWIHNIVKNYMSKSRIVIDLIMDSLNTTPTTIKHYAINVRWKKRPSVIYDVATMYGDDTSKTSRTIIFAEKKSDCNIIAMEEKLASCGIQAIHGDISQKQRESTVQAFRDGKFRYLVATNVCARGIDIPEVDLVINCEPPNDVESYIHRSGRTGRAGRAGISVILYSPIQESQIYNIKRVAKIDFIFTRPPQQEDILHKSLTPRLEKIISTHNKSTNPIFNQHAQHLINEIGDPLLALSATLHVLFNADSEYRPRSILTDNEGFYTLIFKTDQFAHSVGYVRSIIQRNFPDLDVQKDITNMILAEDSRSVIVDINSDKVKIVKSVDGNTEIFITDIPCTNVRGVTITLADVLPKLRPRPSSRNVNNERSLNASSYHNNNRRNGNSYANNGSSYDSKRNNSQVNRSSRSFTKRSY